MSYLAIVTRRFEEMVEFYGATLGGSLIRSWDRPGARGRVFELEGLRLEILDAERERRSLRLEPPDERFQLVLEVDDVDAIHGRLPIPTEPPRNTSWNARILQLRDPDGLAVTYLQWYQGETHSTS